MIDALALVVLALMGVALWRQGRQIAGLSAQLAVLTIVVHDVRDQIAGPK